MTRERKQHSSNLGKSAAFTAAILLVLAVGTGAEAYEINQTASGHTVRWTQDEIRIVLDPSLSAIGPLHEVEALLREAFETWITEAELPMDFTLESGVCDAPGFHANSENSNCVMACAGCVAHGEDVGAKALVSHVESTGEVVDADIVFFTDAGQWSLDGDPGALDFRAVALHEIGHALGLGHSEVDGARMFSTTSTGDQTHGSPLHQDDLDGAGAIYGPGVTTAGCGWRCSAAPGVPGGLLLFVAFVALVALRRFVI